MKGIKWQGLSAFHSSRDSRYQVPTRAPGAVGWGHSWPHEWTLSKKTLWRYPFWWLNRLSPEVEAITDKKKKKTLRKSHCTWFRDDNMPADFSYRLQTSGNFSLTHSYAHPKLQNLQSWRRGWWVWKEFVYHENGMKASFYFVWTQELKMYI